ncbi:hypothetical protein K440DRAFT_643476 [Wilcoxina mikolae CBS 423.85]|nr:hypothetical protein K440DRAFT_643476 [Wilcoxina mikolae CBS 423.85]
MVTVYRNRLPTRHKRRPGAYARFHWTIRRFYNQSVTLPRSSKIVTRVMMVMARTEVWRETAMKRKGGAGEAVARRKSGVEMRCALGWWGRIPWRMSKLGAGDGITREQVYRGGRMVVPGIFTAQLEAQPFRPLANASPNGCRECGILVEHSNVIRAYRCPPDLAYKPGLFLHIRIAGKLEQYGGEDGNIDPHMECEIKGLMLYWYLRHSSLVRI